ncbi:MAG: alpha/beta hydrolase [Vicinamibacterales bacterium]
MPTFSSRLAGARLYYQDLGGRGAPIVFLHGMGCSSSHDYPVVANAAPLRGRRRLLLDLLGSGYSDRPRDFDYTVAAHAVVVAEVLRALDLRSVCLYGHSLSGAVAIVVAQRLRGRVRRLVLSEPNLDPGGGNVSRAIASQRVTRYVHHGHAALVRSVRSKGQDAFARTLGLALPVAIHREAVSLVEGTRPSWRQILAGLPMPRTVLFGAHSLPDPDTRQLPEIGVRVRIVPRAGHGMAQDNPAGLARALASAAR